VGSYTAIYPFGQGSLRLRSDGQYEQVLQINGRVASARGEWKYLEEGGQGILLQRCLSATDGAGRLNEQWETPYVGACGPSVGRRFVVAGAIEIADDEEYVYRKVSGSATSN
jgi:hypothetical protein